MRIFFKLFAVVSMTFILSSCEKSMNGACEKRWGTSSYSYYCNYESDPDNCDAGWEKYFEDCSCKDLGYTEKHKGDGGPISGPTFVSPEGKEFPGEYGYFSGYRTPSSGGSGGSGGTSTYDWSYTCPSGTKNSAPITKGPCEEKQKAFAKAFGCNLQGDMYKACRDWYGCEGMDITICDAYK